MSSILSCLNSRVSQLPPANSEIHSQLGKVVLFSMDNTPNAKNFIPHHSVKPGCPHNHPTEDADTWFAKKFPDSKGGMLRISCSVWTSDARRYRPERLDMRAAFGCQHKYKAAGVNQCDIISQSVTDQGTTNYHRDTQENGHFKEVNINLHHGASEVQSLKLHNGKLFSDLSKQAQESIEGQTGLTRHLNQAYNIPGVETSWVETWHCQQTLYWTVPKAQGQTNQGNNPTAGSEAKTD